MIRFIRTQCYFIIGWFAPFILTWTSKYRNFTRDASLNYDIGYLNPHIQVTIPFILIAHSLALFSLSKGKDRTKWVISFFAFGYYYCTKCPYSSQLWEVSLAFSFFPIMLVTSDIHGHHVIRLLILVLVQQLLPSNRIMHRLRWCTLWHAVLHRQLVKQQDAYHLALSDA